MVGAADSFLKLRKLCRELSGSGGKSIGMPDAVEDTRLRMVDKKKNGTRTQAVYSCKLRPLGAACSRLPPSSNSLILPSGITAIPADFLGFRSAHAARGDSALDESSELPSD